MVSLSAMLGLNPHLRVFVFASPNTGNEIIDALHKISPEIEALTPREELNELSTLTRLGCVTTIIIADYPNPAQTDGNVLEGLTYAFHIIVIKEYEATGLANVVVHSFPQERIWRNIPFDRLSIVKLSELEDHMKTLLMDYSQFRILKSPFNWRQDYNAYIFVIKLIAILSLILLLLQTVLASLFALTREKLIDLFEVILISVATFLFSQTIYMVCSVAVGMPLGLHATAYGVTALSQLGHFSELYSRTFFCLLGFILGSMTFLRKKLFRPSRLVTIGVTISVALVSIFLVSQYFAQLRLLLAQMAGLAFSSLEKTTASYFYPVTSLITSLSAFTMTSFSASRGVAAYFSGVIASFLLRKTQKITRLILLLLCLILIGYGGAHVGNMLPYQTYASIVPGILLGLLLVALFIAFDRLEKAVRTSAHKH